MRWFQSLLFLSYFVAQSALADDTFQYTVVAGDSCGKIAKKFYGATARYDMIHKYNQLGPTPHKLKPGTVLTLPSVKTNDDPDAVLSQKKGNVEARSPSDSDWKNAERGQDLFKAWKVGSKEAATAEITFRDDSSIYMRENTVVVIYGDTSSEAKKTESTITEASLEKGTLSSHLDALSGKKVTVTAGTSKTDLTGGSAVISVDELGATRVCNQEGKSAKVSSTDVKGSVEVKPGMGTKVEPKKAPTKPKPIPTAPLWTTAAVTLVSYAYANGGTASVHGEWEPVKDAASYHLELLQDKAVLENMTLPANASAFDFEKLPAGIYQVRVSAIDKDKFEGKPSKKLIVSVAGIATEPPSDDIITHRILVGSYFVAPIGFLCSVAGGKASAKIEVQKAGAFNISCENETTKLQEIRLQAYESNPVKPTSVPSKP
jgi:hypothetical protein